MELSEETANALNTRSEMRFFLNASLDAFSREDYFQSVATFVNVELKDKLATAGMQGIFKLVAVQVWGKHVYATFDVNRQNEDWETAHDISKNRPHVFHVYCRGTTLKITRHNQLDEVVNLEVAKAHQLNRSIAPPFYSDHSPGADPLKYKWHVPARDI